MLRNKINYKLFIICLSILVLLISISLYVLRNKGQKINKASNLSSNKISSSLSSNNKNDTLNNLPFIIDHIPTDKKEVFLTIDDGAEKDPNFIEQIKDQNLHFTMFLTDLFIKNNYDYFKQLQSLGNFIEDHTINHPKLTNLTYDQQRDEICSMRDKITNIYGVTPILFRPPGGFYNDNTIRASKDCGMKHMILWRVTMQETSLEYQVSNGLRNGDIILAHFRGPSQLKGESMVDMITHLIIKVYHSGFIFGNLNNYIQ